MGERLARRFLLAATVALALFALGGQAALAGGGGHIRALLTTDPAAPTAGDMVTVVIRFATDVAPNGGKAYATPPGGDPLTFGLKRLDARTLVGGFFADRGGTWRISTSIGGLRPLALEVRGSPAVLRAAPAVSPEVPVGMIVALALLPYALAVPVWLAVRSRTPAASYQTTKLDLERKVA